MCIRDSFNAPPPASCGALLCAVPGMSVGRDWLTGAHQATLQISVSTTVDPSTYHRLPMNLVVVVDHSGSMAADGRLDKVKVGLHTLIDHLQAGFRLLGDAPASERQNRVIFLSDGNATAGDTSQDHTLAMAASRVK